MIFIFVESRVDSMMLWPRSGAFGVIPLWMD